MAYLVYQSHLPRLRRYNSLRPEGSGRNEGGLVIFGTALQIPQPGTQKRKRRANGVGKVKLLDGDRDKCMVNALISWQQLNTIFDATMFIRANGVFGES